MYDIFHHLVVEYPTKAIERTQLGEKHPDLADEVSWFVDNQAFVRDLKVELSAAEYPARAEIRFTAQPPVVPWEPRWGRSEYVVLHETFIEPGDERLHVACRLPRLELNLSVQTYMNFVNGNRLDSGHEPLLRSIQQAIETHAAFTWMTGQ